jgi:hypothetical protein
LKNQYFGDVNDYRKYGFLRLLQSSGKNRFLISWMLTPNDKRRDGSLRKYLSQPQKWRAFDSDLYDGLKTALDANATPMVSLIETSKLLPRTAFYNKEITDSPIERSSWKAGLKKSASKADLVFFDPDNGIEIQSIHPGNKNYSKYVAKDEIKMVWDVGCSILVYQHFPRKPHKAFVLELVSELERITGSSFIRAFSASQVLYLLIAQKKHQLLFERIISNSLIGWKDQIQEILFSG